MHEALDLAFARPVGVVERRRQLALMGEAHPLLGPPGKEMEHSAMVLLFDRNGKFVATIATDDPEPDALAKLKSAVA